MKSKITRNEFFRLWMVTISVLLLILLTSSCRTHRQTQDETHEQTTQVVDKHTETHEEAVENNTVTDVELTKVKNDEATDEYAETVTEKFDSLGNVTERTTQKNYKHHTDNSQIDSQKTITENENTILITGVTESVTDSTRNDVDQKHEESKETKAGVGFEAFSTLSVMLAIALVFFLIYKFKNK